MADLDRLMSVFQEALQKCRPEDWDGFVREAAGDDEELYQQTCQLLKAHARGDSLLDRPPAALCPDFVPQITEKPGTAIGKYKLLEQIGEGGFGVVFLAEQEQPVRRRVALKVIKPGMDTSDVIQRFEAERQALALMDHPHIAKVFDAGATPSGRPYFVMELVQGVPITDYCDQCCLTPRERLELFVIVCLAVQHAHQKGIIHRDIKPTNVLVARQDGQPVPKIIDFGVAKATGQRLTEQSLMTGFTQMLGTPPYMSPEQAELSPLGVDTRSDVYSLGVLMYELLAGMTPFDRDHLEKVSYDELRRIIREEEPPLPSTRISTLSVDLATTIAEQRRSDVRRLRQTVRGDLDWIVMKSLDKNCSRRYESASGLAADILRYLRDEPVHARPPSFAYRFHKFARRHKNAVAMTAALIALMASTLIIVRQRQQASFAHLRAERLAQETQERFYAADMRLAFKSWSAGDRTETLKLLERYLPEAGQSDLRGFEWFFLRKQVGLTRNDAKSLRGHTGNVYFVTFSPDDTQLATASEDGTAKVWETASGRLVTTFQGHAGEVNGVAFSPDASFLASAGDDHTVRLWNVASGREIAVLRGHTGPVFNAIFAPDGQLLASGGVDGLVKLWDPLRGHPLATLQAHADDVEHLAFSPDGRLLATAGGEQYNPDPPSVKLWDVAERRQTATLRGHGTDVLFVAFGPDGRLLASASADRTVKLWDVEAKRLLRTLRGHRRDVHSIAFSPDGATLATASRDGTVRLWDVASGHLRRGAVERAGPIWSVSYSNDGNSLATAGDDHAVTLWNLHQSAAPPQQRLAIQVEWLVSAALSNDGRCLATIGRNEGSLEGQVWDTTDGSEVLRFARHSDRLSKALAFSPTSDALAFHLNGRLQVWDVASGRELLIVPYHEIPHYAAISPDNRLVAMGAPGVPIKIWRIDTGRLQNSLDQSGGPVASIAFSPDGQTLAGLASDGGDDATEAWLWNIQTGRVRAKLQGQRFPVSGSCVACSPDGSILATVGGLTAHLWDAHTRSLRASLSGHDLAVTWGTFSPDGRTLATASDDHSVRLWHATAGQELATLRGHTGPVQYVAFLPDGRRLLSAGNGAEDRAEFFVWSGVHD